MQNKNQTRRTVRFAFAFVLIVSIVAILPGSTQADSRGELEESNATTAMISPQAVLNPDGSLNLAAMADGAVDLRRWDVTLDAVRGPVLAQKRAAPAAPNAAWFGLAHQGLNERVNDLLPFGVELLVGGEFTATQDGAVAGLNNIATYSGGAWSAMPNGGLNNDVYALAKLGTDVYVGGLFTKTADGSIPLNRIAKYNGSWSALPKGGLNNPVFGLTVYEGALYAAGVFTATNDGTVSLNRVAKFDGTSWSALPNGGMNNSAGELQVMGNDLYVGGLFTGTADGTKTLNYIARYDGTSWSALPNNGLNGRVLALAADGEILYVGGDFSQTVDGAVANLGDIATYNGANWSALPNQGLNGQNVQELAVKAGDLYVGGDFVANGDGTNPELNNIGKFSGGTWAPLPKQGLNAPVKAILPSGDSLFVGGDFTQTFVPGSTLNHIAVLDIDTGTLVAELNARVTNAGKVKLKWSSTTETSVAGYKVFRRKAKGVWKQLSDYIPAKNSGGAAGQQYGFKDKQLKGGNKYQYKIQVIQLDKQTEWSKVVKVKIP